MYQITLTAAMLDHLRARLEGDNSIEGTAIRQQLDSAGIEPLNNREREVALLAAQGLGNEEIAEKLHRAVKTVANQLSACYRKLGIKGRKGLTPMLHVFSVPTVPGAPSKGMGWNKVINP